MSSPLFSKSDKVTIRLGSFEIGETLVKQAHAEIIAYTSEGKPVYKSDDPRVKT